VDALLREGISADVIALTGNTVIDALLYMKDRVEDPILENGERYILVTAHRRENFGPPLEQLCMALRDLVQRNENLRVIYPVHLNPRVRETVYALLGNEPAIQLTGPVSYGRLVVLMKGCYLVLTDSGGIQEEAPALGKPVLVLRDLTERPEAVAAGAVKVIGANRESIVRETEALLRDTRAYQAMSRPVSPYGDGRAAERIVEHLAAHAPRSVGRTQLV
jgi:UDP-N-acetylglucosamine 2-epimerase (non-hydrolysing)